jgi:CRP/FNR family transcriptional regulator, cyclic AMP receptor protein
VGGGKTILKYHKDETVFSQGDVSDAIFYIQKGKIQLAVVSERGKEAVLGLIGIGHFFGENCLSGHPLRITAATAIEDCLITRIAKAAMIATLRGEPKFSELFMADLLSRNSRIEEDLIDQLFNSSEKGSPAPCFCLPISARKPGRRLSSGSLARKPSQR